MVLPFHFIFARGGKDVGSVAGSSLVPSVHVTGGQATGNHFQNTKCDNMQEALCKNPGCSWQIFMNKKLY
jgi:hypothetical protein